MELQSGMPGTISQEAKQIRWYRAGDVKIPHTNSAGRGYVADVPDGQLLAVVSHDEIEPGKFLWHISVSHNKNGEPDRCPQWDEMKSAKYQLLPEVDVPMVLIFPRRKGDAPYVDVYQTCLHLWESKVEGIDA